MATPGSACELRYTGSQGGGLVEGRVSDDGRTCVPTQTMSGFLTPLNAGVACGSTTSIPGYGGETIRVEARCPH